MTEQAVSCDRPWQRKIAVTELARPRNRLPVIALVGAETAHITVEGFLARCEVVVSVMTNTEVTLVVGIEATEVIVLGI
jgi:hypothetical protein